MSRIRLRFLPLRFARAAEQNVIAVLFDCDGTLCEDTTTFVLTKYDVDINRFWGSVNKLVRKSRDPPLVYLSKIIQMAQSGRMSDLTCERLRRLGAEVDFFPGIPQMFDELNGLISPTEEFREAEVTLEYYLISSGFEEVIRRAHCQVYEGHFCMHL